MTQISQLFMLTAPHTWFIVAQVMSFGKWLSIIARSELGSDLVCSVINARSELGSDLDCYELNIKGNHLITAMARYRMSSHDLKIERGRFNNPITPINQRICTRCESNEIDDEIHLLLHCNAMNSEREILLNSIAGIINMQPTNDIFLRIMTSRDITVVKSLAKFIYCCFKQIKGYKY